MGNATCQAMPLLAPHPLLHSGFSLLTPSTCSTLTIAQRDMLLSSSSIPVDEFFTPSIILGPLFLFTPLSPLAENHKGGSSPSCVVGLTMSPTSFPKIPGLGS